MRPLSIRTTQGAGYRKPEQGLSIIEVLAASAIVTLCLIALVSTWLYMIRASIVTDDRGAAYECARMVMERARSSGYISSTDFGLNQGNAAIAVSTPVNGEAVSQWISPNLVLAKDGYRFYDTDLNELSIGTTAPENARYAAATSIIYSNDAAGRKDLKLMTIFVTVYAAKAGSSPDTSQKLADLQTCLAEGGA